MKTVLDRNVNHWYVANSETLLGEIVDIMFIRRVIDKISGVDISAPLLASYLTRVPDLAFAFPAEADLQRFQDRPV